MADGPTHDQQADYLVRKLEQTIRDNRTVRGMSFRTWQALAREEILNALKDGDRRRVNDERTMARVVLGASSAVVTIGFWGAAVVVDHSWGFVAAMASGTAAACLLLLAAHWGIERAMGSWAKKARELRLSGIESLDRRIKRMEAEMTRKADRLKDKMEGEAVDL